MSNYPLITYPLIHRDPLPTIELPRELIMKIQTTNELTINDAYEVKFTFTPRYDVFRDRVLTGNEAIQVLSTDYKFAIYGHIDSVLRSGAWHHSKVSQELSDFIETRRQERLEVIDKGIIT